MIGLFLVTHGTLGEALIQCVCHVLDKRPPLLGQLGLSAGEDPADALPLARRMIATVDDGEGVLLLADLYGATPCNVATRLIEPGRIELVAGVNLPMLLKALGNRRCPLEDLAAMLIDSVKNGIVEVKQAPPETPAGQLSGESDGAA